MPFSAALLLAGALPFAAEAEIRGEVVRLGDVADVAALPPSLRAAAAALPLARFDREALQAGVSRAVLASRARARMPALAAWLDGDAKGSVRLHRRLRAGMPVVVAAKPEGIARGEAVAFNIDAGVFRITRDAVAMNDAKPGERLFVRTAEGEALAVRCVEGGQ